jgi:hypothetical protein
VLGDRVTDGLVDRLAHSRGSATGSALHLVLVDHHPILKQNILL